MRGKKRFILLLSLALVLLISNVGVTSSSLFDLESSSGNTFQAWISRQWTQTTEGDFNAGVLNNVNTSLSPGNVQLENIAQEPTTSVGSEESWHHASWSRRAPVTINNTGSALTDYQVRVDVTYDADMQPDFDDIRFVDSDDSTELSHWRESYIASTSAVFWVKVPSIPSGTKAIYMYYGNGTASSASDGDATFVFFDDFESGNLDKWTIVIDTFWSVATDQTHSGTYSLKAGGTSSSDKYISATGINQADVLFDAWWYNTATTPDIAQNVRASTALPLNDYHINWEGQWTIAEMPWNPLNSVAGSLPQNTWFKMTIIIQGTSMKVLIDDAQINPVSGWLDVGTTYASGSVAFRAWTASNNWWIDDCLVRQYADPEPTASIGTEDGWSRRAPVTINNPGFALTDYQVRVDITYDADMQPDFDDIRFRDSDGVTPLSHWRESYIASTSAVFWVKVPSIPAGAKTIYIYYGNGAASSASDGDATFEFFDDFEDGDISDWFQYGSGTVQIANDGGNFVLLKTANNDPNGGYSLFNNGSLSNFEVVLRTKRINENGGSQNRYGIEDGSFNGYGPRMYDFNSLPSNFAIERRTGGASTNLVVKSTSAYQWDTWMTVKFRKSGDILEFELYDSTGSLVDSISTSNSLYNSFDRFVVHGGWEYYTDDIRVRKYIQPAYPSSGTIDSQVLDTGINGDRWDALFWDETLPAGTNITFEVRASDTLSGGFPDTAWIPIVGDSPVISGLPSGRYMQWRATLTTSDPSETPILHEVRVYHY